MTTAPDIGMPSALALGDWLAVAARQRPSQGFLIQPAETSDEHRTLTFAEAASIVNRLGRAMRQRGLGHGDRLGVVAVDSIEHVLLVLACFKTGIVLCDLNYRLKSPELINIVTHCPVDAMFVSSRYLDLLHDLERSGAFEGWSCVLDGDVPEAMTTFDQLVAEVDDASDYRAAAYGEDLLTIAFTSGTTGTPKGVMQSERMLRNVNLSGIRETRLRPGGYRYSGAPMFHISGLSSFFYAMGSGSGSLVIPQFDPEVAVWWLQHAEITSCLLIPTLIGAMLAVPAAHEAPYPHLRSIMYGGAPMPPSLLRDTIEVFGCDLFNGFGAGTEAGGQTMLGPEEHIEAVGGRTHLLRSIGTPILGVDLRLCDEDLNDVPPGEIGEIVTRSNTIMSGYFGQPELTARAVVDGWFRAGDMAHQDEEGYLYLEARKSDMIIRGGENVYPIEIETVLGEHPDIVAATVVGIPDPHWGEVIAAALVVRDAATTQPDLIRTWCRERLASYKVPEHVVVFEGFPMTASGKLIKSEIRARLVDRLECDEALG